jgi:uncharacterized delta-60 repeat protein
MRNSPVTQVAGLILIAAVASVAPVHAAAGSLDPTFGRGGKVVTNFGHSTIPADAVLQTDGKIVIAAGFDNTPIATEAFGVIRYNTNGTLDTSFGSSGRAIIAFTNFINAPSAMALQPDGKIVEVGTASSADGTLSEFAVARFDTNGTLDSSFGVGGMVTTNFVGVMLGGVSNPATAVILQSDGKIIVAGEASESAEQPHFTALARYLSNGSLDTSFGNGGMVSVTAIGAPGALALGALGDLFAVSLTSIVEFSPTGALDSSVTPETIVTTSSTGATAFQPNGQFVVAGAGGSRHHLEVQASRFNLDGTADPTFVSPAFDFGTPISNTTNFVQGIAFQANGQILLGGGFTTGLNGDVFGLARLNAGGSLDATFGNSGKLTTTFMNGDQIVAVLLQSDGKIVAVGQTINRRTGIAPLALARYLGN